MIFLVIVLYNIEYAYLISYITDHGVNLQAVGKFSVLVIQKPAIIVGSELLGGLIHSGVIKLNKINAQFT